MSAMKDLHIESLNLEREWHVFLEHLFAIASLGEASSLREALDPSDEEEWDYARLIPDLTLTASNTGEKVAVEFKVFRWRSDWQSHGADAVSHMREILDKGSYERGIVILSLEAEQEDLAALAASAGETIKVWDLFTLRGLVGEDEQLADELEALVAETQIDSYNPAIRARSTLAAGAALASRLRAIPGGHPGWQDFEQTCYEAVKFLFGRELHHLVQQQRTDDELNRMDLIGRIRAERDSFWSMLSTDFSTRYVIFDAKNSEAPIGQQEIEITGKYLFRHGRRNVAVIIAREGANENAHKAIAGKLRETGNLLMVISATDLCTMLEGADAGDPPENLLFARLDAALMAMGR